jgi:hypothetical protein
MKLNTILVMVAVILIVLFMFKYSGYENKCTSDNKEFKEGKRCFDENDRVSLSGPFCKEECKGKWK